MLPEGYKDWFFNEVRTRRPDIDPEVLWSQLGVESSYNPRARSEAGALGLAQFMPATGKAYGLETEEDFYDPYKSGIANIEHMGDLVDEYGNMPDALAGYHAGSDLSGWGERTQSYPVKVMGEGISPEMQTKVSAARGGRGSRTMAMDPYMAMISGAPTSEARQRGLANALRRDQGFADLGMITGDPVLSAFGQQLSKRPMQQAKDIGADRRSALQRTMMQRYYDAQIEKGERSSDLAERKHELEQEKFEHEKRMDEAEAAQAGTDYNKLRTSDINDLSDMGMTIEILDEVSAGLEDEDFDPGRQDVLGKRTVNNLLAQYGVGTEENKKVQEWWRQVNRFYTLPERNKLFGATLTANEQTAWAGASINPEMTKAQIDAELAKLRRIYNRAAKKKAMMYREEGYNPDSVSEALGKSYYEDELEISIPVPEENVINFEDL